MPPSPETTSVETYTSKPPHILLINNFFAPDGGAELSTLANYHLLKEKNMTVSIFATDRKPYFLSDEALKPFTPYFPHYIDYDKTSGILGKLQQVQRIFYNHECEKKLNQFLEKNRPDLVHCNNIHYHLTPSILKACQDHQIPVIMTVRDARLMCPSGTLMIGAEKYCEQELCVTGSAFNCLKHKCYEKSFSKSAVVTAEFIARDFHHLYDSITKFVFPSEAMLELAARSGIPRNKLVKINNFAEDKIVNLVPSFQGGNYFLFVGRLYREKGVHLILEALQQLDPNFPVHIVGTGPEEEALQKQAQALGLQQVIFKGFLSGEALYQEYQNCLAAIVPSNWFENFARGLVEASAFGKPSIGSNIGGIPEVVRENETGHLFPMGNAKALSEAMGKIKNNPERAIEMGRNARQYLEDHLTAKTYINKLLALYDEVLSPSRS